MLQMLKKRLTGGHDERIAKLEVALAGTQNR
jgi:hypothetical protein